MLISSKEVATEEEEGSTPPCEAVLPRGVMEEGILPKRYETFTSDNDWVQCMRCSLLGLEAGTTPSRKDIDTSDHLVPRAAVFKLDLPEVITNHWLPILRREGLLVKCPPDKFTATVVWVPLYTREGLQKYLRVVLSSFTSQGTPSLTAIVPHEFRMGTDKEFLLSNFHRHECLMRQSFNLTGRHRQLAFCPYCRVINENKHMQTQCPSVTAIQDCSKSSRR